MHDFDLNILRDLLVLCASDVQFLFNGQFYRQIDGVAMGSCLGPIFADIFVGFLESKVSSVICKSHNFSFAMLMIVLFYLTLTLAMLIFLLFLIPFTQRFLLRLSLSRITF